jgi:hypothetical protein
VRVPSAEILFAAASASSRNGPTPRVETVTSITAELDLVADQVRRCLVEGPVPETVAVLVHDRYQRDRIVTGLASGEVARTAGEGAVGEEDRGRRWRGGWSDLMGCPLAGGVRPTL